MACCCGCPFPGWLPAAGSSFLGAQAVLTQALGVLGMVRKERLLYLVGQTRVHLDSVEGLGDFVELEVSGAWLGRVCQPQGTPGLTLPVPTGGAD